MTTPIHRKLVAEAAGTMFLVTAVIGSGIAASRLSPQDTGLQLLENAIATGTALTALILALQPVSAAFNPVVTVIEASEGTVGRGHAPAPSAPRLQVARSALSSPTSCSVYRRFRSQPQLVPGPEFGSRKLSQRPVW